MGAGVAQQMELHVIVIRQDNVGQSCGDVARREKLFLGGREGHRCAGVDKDISKKIDLFAKKFYI